MMAGAQAALALALLLTGSTASSLACVSLKSQSTSYSTFLTSVLPQGRLPCSHDAAGPPDEQARLVLLRAGIASTLGLHNRSGLHA